MYLSQTNLIALTFESNNDKIESKKADSLVAKFIRKKRKKETYQTIMLLMTYKVTLKRRY